MSNLSVFNFESYSVRTVTINNEPWFVGKDVAVALGYADPTSAVRQHCKGVAKHHPLQTAGGLQELRVLSEPDVLRLIVGSQLPAAQVFERWVFEEVLPSIRKTGKYEVSATQPILSIREQATAEIKNLLTLANLFSIPEHLAQVEAVKEVRLSLGVDYSNYLRLAPAQQNILREEESLEPTELGKTLGISAIKLNQMLADASLQVKTVEGWVPTEAGKPYASRHQWVKAGKSGYNYKWRRSVLGIIK